MNKKQIKDLIGKNNPTILEIGCNDGTDSIEFLREFSDIKLYCFEPDVRAIRKFKSRIQDNRCKLFEMALGNIDGDIDFYACSGTPSGLHTEWDKSGSIKKPKNHLIEDPWCKFEKITRTKCNKLDTWISNYNIEIIDFIWADVQGAEEDLVTGGIKTLNEKTRFFYTEYSDKELYENQIKFDSLTKLLDNFYVVERFSYDVLLKNKNME